MTLIKDIKQYSFLKQPQRVAVIDAMAADDLVTWLNRISQPAVIEWVGVYLAKTMIDCDLYGLEELAGRCEQAIAECRARICELNV